MRCRMAGGHWARRRAERRVGGKRGGSEAPTGRKRSGCADVTSLFFFSFLRKGSLMMAAGCWLVMGMRRRRAGGGLIKSQGYAVRIGAPFSKGGTKSCRQQGWLVR